MEHKHNASEPPRSLALCWQQKINKNGNKRVNSVHNIVQNILTVRIKVKFLQCIGRSEMIQIRSRSRSYFGKNRQELAQFLVVVNYRDSDLIWLIFLEKKKIQIRSFQILLHDKYKQNFIKKQQNFSQIWPKSC